MRNLKRNVSAFVICLGLTITMLSTPAVASATTKMPPVPGPSVSVVAELEANVLNLLDLNLLAEAGVTL